MKGRMMPVVSPCTRFCRQGTGRSRSMAGWNRKIDRGQFGIEYCWFPEFGIRGLDVYSRNPTVVL